jgi:hypothetical protein
MYLGTVGEYVLELSSADVSEAGECEQTARVVIDVVPVSDIYVELDWDVASEFDPEDGVPDLDLHYLHPNGQWNEEPWDAFGFQNSNPDWGIPDDETDDPLVWGDGSATTGPETVEHDYPEAGLVYQVGVYYYSDYDRGAARADLRVYLEGELALATADHELPATDAFWRAAFIDWSARSVQKIDRDYNGFPNR